ncbi:Zn finger-containing GTPase- Activating Protein for ARF [Podochytrium sp. JEL0797]|nr:Zn finger-containing GTPase- Activating Protein for ARF [Podochytrium sp. JEL0797]
MDKWSEDQKKRMRLGGNQKALEFFRACPGWREGLSIKEKYSSDFAKLYKEKLSAECEGRPWSMPDAAEMARQAEQTQRQQQQQQQQRQSSMGSTGYQQMGGSGGGASNSFKVDASYFAQKGSENQTRSADLPPSQGGKYAGFGSSNNAPTPSSQPADLLADPLQALNLGWSMFTSTVTKASQLVTENVINPTATALADPNLSNNLSSTFSSLQQKAVEGGSRGISFVRGVVDQAANQAQGREAVSGEDDDWNDLLRKAEALKRESSVSAAGAGVGARASGTAGAGASRSTTSNGSFGGFDNDFDADFDAPTAATNTTLKPKQTSGGFGGFDAFEKKRSSGTGSWNDTPPNTVVAPPLSEAHVDGHQKKSDWDTDDTWEEF